MTQIETGIAIKKKRGPVKHGHARRTEGRQVSKEYAAWQQMLNRVYIGHGRKPQANHGINVHPAWRESFTTFLRDVGMAPSPQHRLVRKDNALDFMPGNVVWNNGEKNVTQRADANRYPYRGQMLSVVQLALIAGISRQAMLVRIRGGWDIEKAVHTPLRPVNRYVPGKQPEQVAASQ